jgi:hypothetical protein
MHEVRVKNSTMIAKYEINYIFLTFFSVKILQLPIPNFPLPTPHSLLPTPTPHSHSLNKKLLHRMY